MKPILSVVTTLYKSDAYITEFVRRVSSAATALVGENYEIVLVNDGSPDDSLTSARQLTKTFAMAGAALLSITLVPVLMGYLVRGRIRSQEANPLNRWLAGVYAVPITADEEEDERREEGAKQQG